MKALKILFTACSLVCFAMLAQALAAPAAKDASLSPYFFVETEDSGVESFPLLDTQVDANITGVIARVKVRQRYANRGSTPIHAKYIFPGSTRAAVHGLTMTVGDRIVRAQIKEKQEARRIHEAAKSAGKSTSLLEQERPNIFSMQVANIMPGDTIDVELEYSELLVPENGQYEFVYPTVVGPRYTGKTEEQAKSEWVANPYLKTGQEPRTGFDIRVRLAAGMPVQEIACASHPVDVTYDGPGTANIRLDTAEFGGNRDYILRYRLSGKQIASGLMLYEGQDENFFLLMAQPPERPEAKAIPDRDYMFVIDVSGSMHGFPLNTSKTLIRHLIGSLRPTDTFNMLFFSGGNELLSPAPLEATEANIRSALDMLDACDGRGGTELLDALNRSMSLPTREGASRSLIVITDGYISAEDEAFDLVRDNLGRSNLFAFGIGSSVNRHLIEGLAKVGKGEPFILTDPSESAAVTARLAEYVASPVLTNIKVALNGFDAYDLEPSGVPDLLAQRPILIFGKWRGERAGSITLSGLNGEGPYTQTFNVGDTLPASSNAGLRYLWARERLVQIADCVGYRNATQNREAIVALGLKYNLLTAHTSFVAVDEVVRNPGGNAKNVKQPLPLPAGVSERAVSVPEPEFWVLLLLFLALVVPPAVRGAAPEPRQGDESPWNPL